MTHDELLAKMDEPNPIAVYTTQVTTELAKEKESYMLRAFEKVGINPNVVVEQNALITQLKAQIRAVVELHKPLNSLWYKQIICGSCQEGNDYPITYPCPTIQAIEKEITYHD